MRASALAIDGTFKLEHDVWRDERGLFVETWNERELARCGLEVRFVQDNLSLSRQWTVRGLHYQIQQPQGKLIRVLTGRIFDVLVDLRRGSPTFRRAIGVHLAADAYEALWVPPGCAHGFLALEPDTRVSYKVTDYWAAAFERTLLWSDSALGIEWPIPPGVTPIVSAKDAAGVPLEHAPCYE
jgi:dTDP-4-dehydrorhamnose 3,5-epimerase